MSDKNSLFHIFRQTLKVYPENTRGTHHLSSIKMVGPRIKADGLWTQRDASFGLQAIHFIARHKIPLDYNFTGIFDALEDNPYFEKTDFLKSDEKADIILINYIVSPPNDDEMDESYQLYQQDDGVSDKHHIKGAWADAVTNHNTKLIFIFGGNNEVSTREFENSDFFLAHTQDLRDTSMQVLIHHDYYEQIKDFASLPKGPSPSSTPSHHL